MKGRLSNLALGLAAVAALALPAQAGAAGWKIEGRGFGHGVGMSQYGAFGFAQHGRVLRPDPPPLLHGRERRQRGDHERPGADRDRPRLHALHRCDQGVREEPERERDLLLPHSTRQPSRFAGRTAPSSQGAAQKARPGAEARSASTESARTGATLRARNVGGSLYAINKVGLEGYVQGVIPNESPASWPQDALRAQAVAARSYALATRVGGDGYDLYDDTRSQVYGGKSSETSATNQATERTARKVIKSDGNVATAYFFSTSGGQTENSEFGFSGGSSRPYLKSVNDPYDDTSPYHRWTVRYSQGEMESKLSGLFGGNLKKIEILEARPLAEDRRGASGRLRRLIDRLGRHPSLPPRPALDLGEVQEELAVRERLQRHAVVGVASAQLVDGRARDLDARVLLVRPLDLQLDV